MESGLKIAICGKGGVGKTTVCAVWSQLFAQEGFEVLAIDADSNPNLSLAFGIPAQSRPQPLIDMKELIEERTGAQKGAIGQYFKMNPQVGDLAEKYALKVAGVKLLVLGGIDQAGSGCACPEGAFLKAFLSHSILHTEEMILVDLEAGMEFLGRASVQGVDALVVVVEPGGRSIEAANNMARMGREMGIKVVAAIANKINDPAQTEVVKTQLKDMVLLGSIRYNRQVQEADLKREAVITAPKELIEQLREAKEALTDLIFSDAKARSG